MKQFLIFLIGALTLFSCNKTPNDKSAKVYTDATVTSLQAVTDSTGKIIKQQVVATDMVAVDPTWGQAWAFAFDGGETFWFILGCVLFLVAAIIFIKMCKGDGPKSTGMGMFLIFILLAAALGSIGTKPATIKWNNTKSFNKKYWDDVIKNENSSIRLWDSLENNCRIVGGPTGGCK